MKRYDLTIDRLWEGCVYSFLIHAIATQKFPEFSYEKSWDQLNFSFNNTCGVRGTISFSGKKCFGAIRNDSFAKYYYAGERINKILRKKTEPDLAELAKNEALLYLLDIVPFSEEPVPVVTSMFTCDSTGLCDLIGKKKQFERDFEAISACRYPLDRNYIKEMWELTDPQIQLAEQLFQLRRAGFSEPIVLTKEQIQTISEENLTPECIDVFSQINIVAVPRNG